MNYRWMLVVAGVFVLASGCASSSREMSGPSASAPAKMAKNTAEDKDRMVCEVERTVGTWIPETVCRHVEQTERNRLKTQDYLNATQGPSIQLGQGTGPTPTHL